MNTVRKGSRTMLKILGVIVLVIVLAFAAVSFVSLKWVYAEGERAGYVQKFSHRGWLCKTWEGEMAMVTMPGTLAEKFAFTVRDPSVAQKINAALRAAQVDPQLLLRGHRVLRNLGRGGAGPAAAVGVSYQPHSLPLFCSASHSIRG